MGVPDPAGDAGPHGVGRGQGSGRRTVTREPVIRVRRVYDPPEPAADGVRVLVDRLWPRGLTRPPATRRSWRSGSPASGAGGAVPLRGAGPRPALSPFPGLCPDPVLKRRTAGRCSLAGV
ncbi:DUF488 family protein [Streptomyces sp. NPDC097617]|uniref:DUF488 family protein, N3 subclade n=1 Tax=Streptomyces sp. NPDC097617 TaxID=3366091 RepID=UPI0038084E9D